MLLKSRAEKLLLDLLKQDNNIHKSQLLKQSVEQTNIDIYRVSELNN